MKLAEIISKLESTADSLCIVARRPWIADSEAMLVTLTEEYRVPDEVLGAGYEYFLEVNVALDEVIGDLRDRLSAAQRVAACIFYAENDAYPHWLHEIAAGSGGGCSST